MTPRQQRLLAVALAASGAVVVAFKLMVLHVGAPYVTIDDNTMYEGGFLVWFGQVPPQRMYLESWTSGLVSMATYVAGLFDSGKGAAALSGNLIADAWRQFHTDPDRFVHSYRWLMLLVDLGTAAIVYCIARTAYRQMQDGWLAALLVAVLYLLSFNTVWSDVAARPDTLTTFFASLGLLLYLRSGSGQRYRMLLGSAFAFGLAAGMKLHAVLFTVFVVFDLLRVLGVRAAFPRAAVFSMVAFLTFSVAAGSVLFDPLLYVKLRYQNAIDDASPWIAWGEQFLVILYGSGWLIVPLVLYGIVHAVQSGAWRSQRVVSSMFFLAMCWLLIFCGIRQLRSYWMLPALPLLYLAAVWALWTVRPLWFKLGATAALTGIMLFQCYNQMHALRSTRYGELRAWVNANIASSEPFYLLGYSGLGMPRSTVAIQNQREGLERKIRDVSASGTSFTLRHAQLWEEQSKLRLFDMLDYHSDVGHTWYGYHDTPLDEYRGIVDWEDFRYVIVQQHFPLESEPELQASLRAAFSEVVTLAGPGGHSNGLEYHVYKRR